ncbi:unnamed protein product [Lymnaea stagnalis]|uniref:Uncharacterized protein n=1 Tax=Lymnaea stagnalis TaxID=6523 RepID=A0AAV2IEI6_LYMST
MHDSYSVVPPSWVKLFAVPFQEKTKMPPLRVKLNPGRFPTPPPPLSYATVCGSVLIAVASLILHKRSIKKGRKQCPMSKCYWREISSFNNVTGENFCPVKGLKAGNFALSKG